MRLDVRMFEKEIKEVLSGLCVVRPPVARSLFRALHAAPRRANTDEALRLRSPPSRDEYRESEAKARGDSFLPFFLLSGFLLSFLDRSGPSMRRRCRSISRAHSSIHSSSCSCSSITIMSRRRHRVTGNRSGTRFCIGSNRPRTTRKSGRPSATRGH